jgi:hypothetical protein
MFDYLMGRLRGSEHLCHMPLSPLEAANRTNEQITVEMLVLDCCPSLGLGVQWRHQ